jgi:DNA-binding SARP family transcriptional activator
MRRKYAPSMTFRTDLPEGREWFVEILGNAVSHNGTLVRVSAGEFAFVVALALYAPCTAERLSDFLRPDADAGRGSTLVRVYVHRIRRRTGYGFVEFENGSYRLSPRVAVDLVEIQRRLERSMDRVNGIADPLEVDVVLELARRLRRLDESLASTWPWFAPQRQRAIDLGRSCALQIARASLDRAECWRVLAIASQLRDEDRCDEEACELAIKARIANGEHAAAIRELRDYQEALRKELDTVPPPALSAWISAALLMVHSSPQAGGESMRNSSRHTHSVTFAGE